MANTKSLQKKFTESASIEVEVVKLRKENNALQETVTKLCKEIDRIREIDRKKTSLILTPEEELLEVQINNLNSISRERKLTLEEVKTLDLLIKNKRLIKKQSTSNNELTLPAEMSDEELERIAASVENKTEGSES